MISSSASSSSSNGQCQRGHHDYHHAASWQTSSGHCVAYRRSKVPIWWQISCTRSLISAPALSRVGATRLPPARGPSLVTSATQLATKKIPRWRYQDAASGNILFPVDVEGRRERNQKKIGRNHCHHVHVFKEMLITFVQINCLKIVHTFSSEIRYTCTF